MAVTIKAGRRYQRRDGSITEPLKEVMEKMLCVDPETGLFYSMEHDLGHRAFPGESSFSKWDLVKEMEE